MSAASRPPPPPPSTEETIQTIKGLEQAVTTIFASSFDADSKTCLITLMKVLDNILHKPGDERVRSIRLSNAAFRNRVASRPGGVEFLLACGFTRRRPPAPLLSSSSSSSRDDDVLVLEPADEKQSRLLVARRLLRQRAVQDLHVKEEELPVHRDPPKVATAASSTSHNNNNNTFNPYVGHRYDGQSAAVGARLGPDANYVSSTDQQLRALQSQQAKLEERAAQQFTDREWKAWTPGETVQWNTTTTTTTSSDTSGNSDAPPPKSDASLLAQRAKALEAARQERETGGFTTAAMRQVAKLKSKKVYSHVQITVCFADQYRVTGKFLPKEKIGAILSSLQQQVLLAATSADASSSSSPREFDLYVAPPRRLLPLTSTLEQEGLVPAAKIFASWKMGSAPTPGQAYLQAHLFGGSAAASSNFFPSAQPIAAPATEKKAAAGSSGAVAPKPKKKKESREEMLLKRMLGKK